MNESVPVVTGDGPKGETMETIRPSDAAKQLGVTTQTVRNYVREGRLQSQPTPGGHNRITVESLDRLKAGSPVPEPSAGEC